MLSSVVVQGFHGIDKDVFLSLPVVVGETGITSVFNQKLNDEEQKRVQTSATTLREVIDGIQL
jgi:malate/lactate dehydrogenase